MLWIPLHQRFWLVNFGLTFGVLFALALWSSLGLESFRNEPFDFRTLQSKELFVTQGLTRRQEGSVKLGFAEAYDPPQIGLYGNHIFRLFGAEAFGRPGDAAYFFNFYFANLALPEIYRYLRHIERLGRLPKKLILIQITSPNLDNGLFIINYGHELPPDLLLTGEDRNGLANQMLRSIDLGWQLIENFLYETLNYNTFILGLTHNSATHRIVDPTICIQRPSLSGSAWLRHQPQTVQKIWEKIKRPSFCDQSYWSGAIRRDGSNDGQYGTGDLIQDEDRLTDTDRGLKSGDEQEIARQMRAIDSLGRRNGVKVAFVIPPAYETDRSNSVVNQVFNRGLTLVPDLTVIDDRDMRTDPSLFHDYRHPSPKYYLALVAELRRRGLAE